MDGKYGERISVLAHGMRNMQLQKRHGDDANNAENGGMVDGNLHFWVSLASIHPLAISRRRRKCLRIPPLA